jgi:hypothetical protein
MKACMGEMHDIDKDMTKKICTYDLAFVTECIYLHDRQCDESDERMTMQCSVEGLSETLLAMTCVSSSWSSAPTASRFLPRINFLTESDKHVSALLYGPYVITLAKSNSPRRIIALSAGISPEA